jgi:hypothetical protein
MLAREFTTTREHAMSNNPDWLALRRKISVKEAAALNNLSEDTFRRRYTHLIKKISPRRDAVEVGDAIAIGEPKSA